MRKILILGFGKTGKDLYNFIKDKDDVSIYDERRLNLSNYYSYQKLKRELPFFDVIIRSPGITSKSKIYQLARMLTTKIVSEVEFLLPYIKNNKIIAITGTNGKTTIITMIYQILKSRYDVVVCGNIGITITSILSKIKKETIILIEISSFQLEDTLNLKPYIYIITNLEPNHLNSAYSLEYYYASKLRLIKNSKIVIVDKKKYIYPNLNKIKEIDYSIYNFNNYDDINFINYCFAIKVSNFLNISLEEANEALKTYTFPKYRNNVIIKRNFIFINDAKSTNIASTNSCLKQYNDKKRIIILGGISKSSSFKSLNIKSTDLILSYGHDKMKIYNSIGGLYFDTLDEILNYIKNFHDNLYIIFSPACASLDQFTSYSVRGQLFDDFIKKNY